MRPLRGLTVLICDDDAADPLCRLVRSYGAACEAYQSFREARARLRDDSEFFDVAIIDLVLLNGRGTDLIRELRVEKPHLPCVLLSGADHQTVMREGLDCMFLQKPVDGSKLCEAILEAVVNADTSPPKPW